MAALVSAFRLDRDECYHDLFGLPPDQLWQPGPTRRRGPRLRETRPFWRPGAVVGGDFNDLRAGSFSLFEKNLSPFISFEPVPQANASSYGQGAAGLCSRLP